MILAACQRFDPITAPEGWKVEPIKNRLRLEYGSGLTDSNRQSGPYPVFGSNGQVGTHESYLVEAPGILVGRKGSVGEVHFTDSPFWPIDTVYYVRRLGEDNWRYLYYLLGYLNLGQLNAATGVPGLTRRDAHFILGAFPKIHLQDEIAKVLDIADEALAASEAKLKAAQQLKTAMMQHLFTRGIPGRHTHFKTARVFRHEFEAPNLWDVGHLRNSVLMVEYGTNAPSNDGKHGLPVVAIPQVIASRFHLGECSYAEVSEIEANVLRLQPDDVLLIRTNGNADYIGKSTVISDDANEKHIIYASYLIRIRTDKAVLSGRYLNYFLASPLGRCLCLAMANTSAGNHNLGSRAIKQFCFPCPLPDEQNEIVSLIDAAEDSIERVQEEIVALEHLKRALLQNLLTGKVRVKPLETSP